MGNQIILKPTWKTNSRAPHREAQQIAINWKTSYHWERVKTLGASINSNIPRDWNSERRLSSWKLETLSSFLNLRNKPPVIFLMSQSLQQTWKMTLPLLMRKIQPWISIISIRLNPVPKFRKFVGKAIKVVLPRVKIQVRKKHQFWKVSTRRISTTLQKPFSLSTVSTRTTLIFSAFTIKKTPWPVTAIWPRALKAISKSFRRTLFCKKWAILRASSWIVTPLQCRARV